MAKKVTIKLPKRVAGIKIPKVVRKGPIGQFLNSSAGQVLLAEALVAAAAIFAAKDQDSTVEEGLRHPVDKARHLGNVVADAGSDQTERLAHAFREAGRAFHEALRGDHGAEWKEATEKQSRKKSSTRASSRTAH